MIYTKNNVLEIFFINKLLSRAQVDTNLYHVKLIDLLLNRYIQSVVDNMKFDNLKI